MNSPSTLRLADQFRRILAVDAAAIEDRRERSASCHPATPPFVKSLLLVGINQNWPECSFSANSPEARLVFKQGVLFRPGLFRGTTARRQLLHHQRLARPGRPPARQASRRRRSAARTRASRAEAVFRPTVRSVSPKCSRLSLWPSSIMSSPAILQHHRRNLTGPGAEISPMPVSGRRLSQAWRRAPFLTFAHSREGRDDEGLDLLVEPRGMKAAQRLRERQRFGQGLVHFPARAFPVFRHVSFSLSTATIKHFVACADVDHPST